jgi:hypothetical protein
MTLVVALFFATPAFAGTVTGKAAFDGTPGENPKIDMTADPVCKSLNPAQVFAERIAVNSNGTLKNVFVYIKEGVEGTFPAPTEPAVLDQKACNYVPHVLGMQANQKLQIINSDATLHNIHAFSKNSPEFNLGMPLQGMKLEKTFSSPEIMVKMKDAEPRSVRETKEFEFDWTVPQERTPKNPSPPGGEEGEQDHKSGEEKK